MRFVKTTLCGAIALGSAQLAVAQSATTGDQYGTGPRSAQIETREPSTRPDMTRSPATTASGGATTAPSDNPQASQRTDSRPSDSTWNEQDRQWDSGKRNASPGSNDVTPNDRPSRN